MIWVLTVHHDTDRWIAPQLEALARHLHEPYLVRAVLDPSIDPSHADRFDEVIPVESSRHARRLDALAQHALEQAAPDDVLLFLDSDSLLVGDPRPTIERAFDAGMLMVAVRRDESCGPWPHPSFCAIRAQTWRDIPGTWSAGYQPVPGLRVATDVGANLLKRIGRRPWLPLLRWNAPHPLHPLWFAVYGTDEPVVYHHGAGSRPPRLMPGTDPDEADRVRAEMFNRLTDPDFWRS